MNELLDKTISQIVTEHHQTAGIFEKYGIDFCCKGKRPLADACTEKQVSTNDILLELHNAISNEKGGTDFTNMKLSTLADYIVQTHHTYVKFNMPSIYQYVTKVATKHGDRFPYMKQVSKLFAELQDDMNQHMLKEERILFPRIKQLEKENASQFPVDYYVGPISVMESEHERAGQILEEIRELTNNYTPSADACTTFRVSLASLQAFEADLHQHVHLENYILFPRTIALYEQVTKTAA